MAILVDVAHDGTCRLVADLDPEAIIEVPAILKCLINAFVRRQKVSGEFLQNR
jgi:hypothetical protein